LPYKLMCRQVMIEPSLMALRSSVISPVPDLISLCVRLYCTPLGQNGLLESILSKMRIHINEKTTMDF
jgi:hypothetical protein